MVSNLSGIFTELLDEFNEGDSLSDLFEEFITGDLAP